MLLPIFSYELKGSAGVLICDSFGESAPGAVKAALTELAGQTSTWIMDLRDNPGGTSTAAAEIISSQTGLKYYPLDTAMAHLDYFSAMKHNIDTLKEALG